MPSLPQYGSLRSEFGSDKQQHLRQLLQTSASKADYRHSSNHSNIPAALLAIVLPFTLFAIIVAMRSFSIRYYRPVLCSIAVICAFLAVAAAWALVYRASSKPSPLYTYFALSMTFAVIVGLWFADTNYWNNVYPFCEIGQLTYYPDVDASVTIGASVLDAGQIVFKQGTHVDESKSMGFKNREQYCVAPIVPADGESMKTYDLWAVGLNCCAKGFKCGDVGDVDAHAGLRLVRREQEDFFALAVQQANVAYHIESKHPLFFHWVRDPVADLAEYQEDANRFYVMGLCIFLGCQLSFLFAVLIFTRKFGAAVPNGFDSEQ